MTNLEYLATIVIIVQVCIVSSAVLNEDAIQREKYTQQKYERYLNYIQYPSLGGLNFTNLPGFDCFSSPEWPGLRRFEFKCNALTPSDVVPENVHLLRPADIKVIGAMGDSLTAANGAGACFLPQLALEYRGKSFSHGGDKTFARVPSLANILKQFNPDLKGYGVETGRWNSSNAGMNVGFPGDVSSDMPTQAERLVAKMKRDPDIDFYNDWKLVTLFIGANDICDWCKDTALYHPQVYVDNIMQSLRILQKKLPRTLVNVVGVLNVPEVEALRGPICDVFHLLWCDCAMFLDEKELTKLTQVTREYQRLLQETIGSGVLDGKPDFTAVHQPFLHNTGVPLTEVMQYNVVTFS
ncbi:phospholipase B1, membrane-associated-like [Anneissia japonica]|uniref:phospholipase B1, membrane-associated-like n=1 Tax=Anneissia japonica TaxID=1529436 RepID=UPI0014259061|nr:phospholipase B1, membrane-associated-like [Anneissia japonica]